MLFCTLLGLRGLPSVSCVLLWSARESQLPRDSDVILQVANELRAALLWQVNLNSHTVTTIYIRFCARLHTFQFKGKLYTRPSKKSSFYTDKIYTAQSCNVSTDPLYTNKVAINQSDSRSCRPIRFTLSTTQDARHIHDTSDFSTLQLTDAQLKIQRGINKSPKGYALPWELVVTLSKVQGWVA